jgi:hypothetical protein
VAGGIVVPPPDADYGQPFHNPVREGLPTNRE